MLKTQIITNTWECDSCNAQMTVDIDPFFSLSIFFPTRPEYPAKNIDLCQTCIAEITSQTVTDYIAGIPT